VVSALVRQLRAVSPAREVTPPQVSFLKQLDRNGTDTVADLARPHKITHLPVTVSTAGSGRRLVRRIPDLHDLPVITDESKASAQDPLPREPISAQPSLSS
jgi:hypothetical protein